MNGRPERIERRAGTDERPILRLAGHAGREAAEALRGAPLAIPAERAPALEPGEYWAHELAGCAVWDGERRVGEVRRMLPLPSCEALEVARDAAAASCSCRWCATRSASVDVGARRIDVDLAFLGSESTLRVQIDVFTLFPHWFDWFRGQRHVANALALGSALECVDYRAHTPLSAGQVDDTPFGGGAGMVLRVDVVEAALRARYGEDPVAAARAPPRRRAHARAAGCSTTRWSPSSRPRTS